MSYVPKAVSRAAHRGLLKLNKNSPTILVVAGVVGFGATAVMASKASRKLDVVTAAHKMAREEVDTTPSIKSSRDRQMAIVGVYAGTGVELTKLYGPTLVVGALSTVSVLAGHNILKGRYVATMAAYTGLFEQFQSYRGRVVDALGVDRERDLYDGASLVYEEDPDHKGEYKLVSKYPSSENASYLRPWFDEANVNWTKDAENNYLFLKGVQSHMNRVLQVKGHVFLNDIMDALRMERTPEGAVTGWLYGGDGDDYIDFGFMTSEDPQTVLFRNGGERSVRLNFNIDGVIWDRI